MTLPFIPPPTYDFWRGRFKRTAELLIDKVANWKKKLEEYAAADIYGK